MPKFEYDAKCESCNGTGIYIGLAEHDGAGVVCFKCDGEGWAHHIVEWQDREPRKEEPRCVRVYEANPGFGIGTKGPKKLTLEDFGGMPYEDWKSGKPFPAKSEMRKFVCPVWWYQTTDYKKKPNWKECEWGKFSECSHFPTKDKCWERFDKEAV